jgi:alpha,alpha-trehalose phosphorylase
VWDFAGTPAEMYPLLLHFHPLTLWRHQVIKQADLVLALITRPDLFTPAQKRAAFDYYDPLTTGDSTLSAPAQAIIAAEVGRHELAWTYFLTALGTDLDDSHGNAGDGVHVAAAAAVWSILVMGFAGFRDWDGFTLDPRLPAQLSRLAFRLRLGPATVAVELTHQQVALTLVDPQPGHQVELTLGGHPVRLTAANPRHVAELQLGRGQPQVGTAGSARPVAQTT